MIPAALLTAVLLGAGVAAEDAPPADAVAREWRVRAWALAPAVGDDLRAALASEAWGERDAALDALLRSFEAAVLRADAVASLLPTVRALAARPDSPDCARALTVLARWPEPANLDSPGGLDTAALAAHPLPAVRLALAQLLAGSGARRDAPARATLARLMGDPDERVARAALYAWAAGADADSLWALVPAASFEGLLRSLELVGAPDAALVSLAAHVSGDPWRASLVEALRLRLHGACAADVAAAGWRADVEAYPRGLLARAARVASVRQPALASELFDRYCRGQGQPAWLLREAVQASDPMHLLARTSAWNRLEGAARQRAGQQVWRALIGREVRWDEAVVAPWLAAPEDDLRAQVVRTLATVDPAHSDAAVGRLLVRALEDDLPRTARLAFRTLAKAADPRPWLGALHAYWFARPHERRVELLTYLPRGVPVRPFRDDLLQLVRAGSPPLVVLGLAEALGPDAELARAVGAEFDLQLEEFLVRLDPAGEQTCIALLRAFVPLAGDGAPEGIARLELLLSQTVHASEKLAKLTAASLGRTPAGRAVLERRRGEDWPSRIQIEGALALAGAGADESFVALLAEHYDTCDWELRRRVIAVCRQRTCDTSFALLARIALSSTGAEELRDSACWALVPRAAPAVEVLTGLIKSSAPVELRAVAMRALGDVEDPRARPFLLGRLEALGDTGDRGAGADPEALDDFDELLLFERAALIETLSRVQPAPDWLVADWLRRPREEARRDLLARFVGTRLAAAEFRWRTELVFCGQAAAAGELGAALARSGAWARIDGRCLAELGSAALTPASARTPSSARALLAAALVALAGEGAAPDRAAVLLSTQRSAWLAAEHARDWPAVVVHARALLDLRAEGRVSEVRWAAEFGEFNPLAGRDSQARLRRSMREAQERIDAARAGR